MQGSEVIVLNIFIIWSVHIKHNPDATSGASSGCLLRRAGKQRGNEKKHQSEKTSSSKLETNANIRPEQRVNASTGPQAVEIREGQKGARGNRKGTSARAELPQE